MWQRLLKHPILSDIKANQAVVEYLAVCQFVAFVVNFLYVSGVSCCH